MSVQSSALNALITSTTAVMNSVQHDDETEAQTPSASPPVTDGPTISNSRPINNSTIISNGIERGRMNNVDTRAEATDVFGDVEIRPNALRWPLRHAHSDVVVPEPRRPRSMSMAEMQEKATVRLKEELSKAQGELKLRDEECEKLLKVRDQMTDELQDLTALLFEEANNMVQEAKAKSYHFEKLLSEAHEKIDVLEAELGGLKTLVLTSTPSSPNKHLHPQIDMPKEKKTSKPFWKTHRRSTSHHEFTRESRQEAEDQQYNNSRCTDIDYNTFAEFREWKAAPEMIRTCAFLSRIILEDIGPCLNFQNKTLSERVQVCVESNTLSIEPIPGDSSFPRKCSLTDSNKLCNYKIRLGEEQSWFSISQLCRNRIAAVCDFYTYIRYIHQELVKSEDKDIFYEILRLRKQMSLARLGYS